MALEVKAPKVKVQEVKVPAAKAPPTTITQKLIINGLKDHLYFQQQLLEKLPTPIDRLNALKASLDAMRSNWSDWSSGYAGLLPFVMQVITWSGNNLAALKPEKHLLKPISSSVTAILASAA